MTRDTLAGLKVGRRAVCSASFGQWKTGSGGMILPNDIWQHVGRREGLPLQLRLTFDTCAIYVA